MLINHYDLSMTMNVSNVNRKVERLEKRVETLEQILATHQERTAKVEKITLKEDITIGAGTFKKGTTFLSKCGACGGYVRPSDIYCVNCGARLEWK